MMKVNEISRVGAINPYKQGNDARLAQSELRKQKQKDEVNISSEAKVLQGLDVSGQHVEALKQSYSTGTYHVEANKIAAKLLTYL